MNKISVIDKHLPVMRMGNSKNPKVVILTFNPKMAGPYQTWPEYKLDQQGKYSDRNMQFADFRKECPWWENILSQTDEFVSDTDILHLEFYPYHSPNSDISAGKPWGNYEKQALVDNVQILRRAIERGAVIIGYYYGEWEAMFPELKFDLYPFYCRCKGLRQDVKIAKICQYLKQNEKHLKNI